MGTYPQALGVLCPVILLMCGMLEAQPKTGVTVGVMVMQVDTGTAERKPVTITSDEAARLLNALLADNTTQIISRSQLPATDGMTSTLKFGDRQWFADALCASSLTKHLGAETNLDITPHIHSSERLTLHVTVSQEVKQACLTEPLVGQERNEFDVRVHDREVTILRGLRSLSSGSASSQLVVALIPTVVPIQDVIR